MHRSRRLRKFCMHLTNPGLGNEVIQDSLQVVSKPYIMEKHARTFLRYANHCFVGFLFIHPIAQRDE